MERAGQHADGAAVQLTAQGSRWKGDARGIRWVWAVSVKRLPTTLTLFRLMAGAAFVPLVLWNAPAWLPIVLLIAGLLSDIADGILARRFGVATLAMRRLDTRADMVFYGCAAVSALFRAPYPVSRLWPWLAAYGLLFAVRNLVDYCRYRASPSYHMWSGKLWSVILFVQIVVLFCSKHAFFLFPVAFACYAINAAEGVTATLMLPQPVKDVPTVWHAYVLRRSISQSGEEKARGS